MATQRLAQRLASLKQSRKYRSRSRKQLESRRVNVERLEDRFLMALTPPAILPNSGQLLNNGATLHVAPQELTFEFNDNVDPTTVSSGIRLIRAGKDGVFSPPNTPGTNDVTITPGFLGLGDDGRQVIMRFASPLPDDIYRVEIIGAGNTPLRDTAGLPFNAALNHAVTFNLDLGAQVIAVVPQPVRRLPNGTLSQTDASGASTRNKIVVYFNNDDLLDGPTGAENPNFYRLYVTRNTLDPNDDLEYLPTQVEYDPATDTAVLTFGQLTSFENFFQSPSDDDGSRDPAKSLRLRIGTDELRRQTTATVRLGATDPGSSFLTARDIGNVITVGTQGTSAQFAQSIEAQTYTLQFPGNGTEPGHRDIPAEFHLDGGPDTAGGIPTVAYNFRTLLPGNFPNLITEAQKQRAREILDLYSRYSGIQFVETLGSGLTIATADLAANPNTPEPSNPGGVIGLAGSGMAIMDSAEVWNDQFGFGSTPAGLSWFDVAMHEIGHLLGLGHTYDLPPHTVMGESGVLVFNSPTGEPVFPGDHDIVHSRVLFRPDSKDIDMYKFALDGTGVFTAESFAERLPNSSSLDTAISIYREELINNSVVRTLIARNDDYFSKDSYVELTLGPGTYYVGISASGNDNYDPSITDSGIGGTTQGDYEVKFNFRKSATNSLVDTVTPANPNPAPVIVDNTSVAFDGDADGTPGGVYNFWFRAAAPSGQQALGKARTIFVDRAYTGVSTGSIAQPYNEIDLALAAAQPYDIVRILGNGGADGNLATLTDNRAYHVGFAGSGAGAAVLRDGSALNVPKDVTVMIDEGAIFQLQRAQISVGSTAPSIFSDRSGGALQVLGTPNNRVYFTSYNEGGANRIGLDENTSTTPPAAADWGGLSFKTDLDRADGRFVHEEVGVFLNYVNHADIRYGGGQVNVNSVFQVVNAIDMTDARPSITHNKLTRNADAAMAANPDSFEETNFQAPRYWPQFSNLASYNPSGVIDTSTTVSNSFTLDYGRVGPDIHGNILAEFDFSTVNSVVVGGVTTATSSAGQTTATVSHTVPAGSNRLLLVSVMTDGNTDVSGITYRGVPLTQAIEHDSGVATSSAVEIWYLSAPLVGVGDIVVTFAGSTDPSVITATNFTGVNPFNPIGATSGAQSGGPGTSISTAITTTFPGSVVFGAISAQRGASAPFAPAPGITERWDVSTGTAVADDIGGWGGTRLAPSPGTLNFAATSSVSDNWAIAAVEIKSIGATVFSNSTNGLSVRTRTPAGSVLEELTVAGRFDDNDITHVIQENLSIRGTPSGPMRESTAPPITLVVPTVEGGGNLDVAAGPVTTVVEYKLVYVDLLGNEGQASDTIQVPVAAGSTDVAIRLENLPIPSGDFVARRIYRRIDTSAVAGAPEFRLVSLVPAQLTTFVDPFVQQFGFVDTLRVLDTDITRARLDGSLNIDPAIIVKADGARIDVGIGATLMAEGQPGLEVIFTSLFDDRYGGGGIFDTPGDNADAIPKQGEEGDWAGFFFGPDSKGSIDHAYVAFGGGLNRVEGTFAGFNTVEIHEADVRIAHSVFDNNADGLGGQAPADRFGRGFNAAGTIFVRGAQPVIIENVFLNNESALININVNALNSDRIVDLGRQTGFVDRMPGHLDNNGPLIDENRLADNGINGMVVRGATLTTEVVWDDTDIVHVLFNAVNVPDFHTYGGLRLESSSSESLVVKALGDTAGITATGRPLEIDDRIGGIVQILGQPGVPVILTAMSDDTATAGFDPDGRPQGDTNGDGPSGGGGGGTGAPTFPPATGELQVTYETNATNLVNGMLFRTLPGGVTITGATYVGAATAAGTYINGDEVALGIPARGIILSTGNAQVPVSNTAGGFSQSHNLPGDVDLTTLAGFNTRDAVVLTITIDVTAASGIKSGAFDFQFGSEEYPEFVGSSFNDVLAGFVNGGAATNFIKDSAGNLVSINSGLFNIDNQADILDVEYDGLTSGLTTKFPLQVGTNVIKIAIADGTDTILDSGVFMSDLRFSGEDVGTGGIGEVPTSGDWQGITIDQFAHDRNVETVLELESPTGDGLTNATPDKAQTLGALAPFEKGGDETLRLGYTIHGTLNRIDDQDVYSFTGRAGTEVWVDLDRTWHALDPIVELIDDQGNVLARSMNSPTESLGDSVPGNLGRRMQKTPPFEGADFYTTNPRDAGMRLVLHGPANSTNTYHLRVRSAAGANITTLVQGSVGVNEIQQIALLEVPTGGSFTLNFNGQTTVAIPYNADANLVRQALEALNNIAPGDVLVTGNASGPWNVEFTGNFAGQNVPQITINTDALVGGLTQGGYQLQLRLREVDEFGGATVRYANIRYALNGIRVLGQPTHSPLAGEHTETNNTANNTRGGAQDLGNLLNSDRGALSVAGALTGAPSGIGDVDWYEMEIRYDATQGTSDERWWSTIFDIDYADGFGRPQTVLHVFNAQGQLVLSSRDSNIADDRPNPLNTADASDLGRGSSLGGDAWIGSAELPEGTYFVAVSNEARVPVEYNQFFQSAAANALVRLEPMNSTIRLVEDHVGSTGGSNVDTVEVGFVDSESITPWTLNDVTLFVTQDGSNTNTSRLLTVDPFSGTVETVINQFGENIRDIAMHPRGQLFTYTVFEEFGGVNRFRDAQAGNYFAIDAGTGQLTQVGDDGIETYMQAPGAAQISPVLANDIDGNGTRVGEGVHFRAMNINYFPGNPLTGEYLGLAIGGRDELTGNGNDFENILYAFNPATGAASSIQVGNRGGNGRLAGAATQIVERGILDTLIDANPTGNADAISVVEATFVDAATDATTFQILDDYPVGLVRTEIPPPTVQPDPTTFQVTLGGLSRLFEFDAGPEAIFQIVPTPGRVIQDGQAFNVNGTRVEFDTGTVLNVTGVANNVNFGPGRTFFITDPDPDPALSPPDRQTIQFEFTLNGAAQIVPNTINVPLTIGMTPIQVANQIAAAINSQQGAVGFATNAVVLPGTARISLTNDATITTINPDDDSDAAPGALMAAGLQILGQQGLNGAPPAGTVRVRIEETSVQADLRAAFNRVNVAGTMPLNSQPGTLGAAGVGRVEVGFDGVRVNFSGATTISNINLNTAVFDVVGSQGGVGLPAPPPVGARIPVPFLAEDDAAQLAIRMQTALVGAGFLGATTTATAVIIPGATVNSADPPLSAAAQASGGIVQGMASINGEVYVVTDEGGLFRIMNPTSAGFARLDYIETGETDLLGIEFAALSAGPRHVEDGRYQDMLFGIDVDGELYAFDTTGSLQAVFASAFNAASGQIEAQTSIQTGLEDVHGLAFSNLDYNLWHTTPNRGTNAGHGINEVHDESRIAVEGGSSLYFGFESVARNNVNSDQHYAPVQGTNNFNFPGGAHGSIETNTFSLKGHAASDKPVLYFNYYLESEVAGHNPDVPIFMRDAFRVFVAGDDGVWRFLGTNNSNRFPGLADDEFDYAPGRIQETWDNTNNWRQVRIPLDAFAGQDNLRLRFDFSTAGSMNVGDYVALNGIANTPTNGDELRAIDAIYLRDQHEFTLTGVGAGDQTFEFDLGYTLVAPGGASIPDGAQFTIDGVPFEFDLNGLGVTGGFLAVPYTLTDSAQQVAQSILGAISFLTPVQVNGNRLNLRGGGPGTVFGANSVTLSGPAMPGGFVEGAPDTINGIRIDIHAGMDRIDVREAIAQVMAVTYAQGDRAQIKTHDEIIRLIGYRWVGQTASPFFDPLNARLLGVTTALPGDEFGAFNASTHLDGTTDPDFPGALRGRNNALEGIYIDDIIIGFAERGEWVTGSNAANDTFTVNPTASIDNTVTGPYTLEVRRGREAGVPNIPPALPPLILLPQMDTNDRLTPSRALDAPDGSRVFDGQTFSLSDGVSTLTFEFNDLTISPASGVAPGRVRIDFRPNDTAAVMAQRVVQAIHSAPVQAVLKIAAQLDDGVPVPVGATLPVGSTSSRVYLIGSVSVPSTGGLTFPIFGQLDGRSSQYGDRNLFRDQGQILLVGNEISHSSEWAIFVDNGTRTAADGNTPHQGPVRTLHQANTQRLVPGVVVTNNLIYDSGIGGILYSGDGGVDAAVPFGRIVNNTIYGRRNNDVGIRVNEGAGPTLMNNIVANLATGVDVQSATSQALTVLGGMLYQGNTTDSNVGLGGDFPIVLGPNEPLFVNAAEANFYLAAQSKAIDSSVDSLLDRPALVTVKSPIGISPSPIIAPERDGAGQARVDDPSVATPGGFGQNVFKDRGAIDRVDFTGPTSVLVNPPDNDSQGNDLDPSDTVVVLQNQILSNFVIRLIDRFDVNGPAEGSDIDDLSVTAQTVRIDILGPTPRTLIQGIDYTFNYDATNNLIILTPLGGLWQLSQTYRITLDNGQNGISDRAGNILLSNQTNGTHSYTIFLGTAVDWGDAPTSFGTVAADLPIGPNHQIVNGVRMGPTIGAEPDGQPSTTADLDTSDDGVTNIALQPGGPINSSTVTIEVSAAGEIDAWIDLNRDGNFLDATTTDGFDAGEYVLANFNVTPGLNIIDFTLPNGPRGDAIARFRFSTLGIGSPHGNAPDGEVEDYLVELVGPAFQNPVSQIDVNNDGFLSPVDALLVIDYLNAMILDGNGQRPLPPQPPNPPLDPTGGGVPELGRYIDVDGNGFLTAADAIIVIDALNQAAGEGEGEGEGESSSLAAAYAPSASRTTASGQTSDASGSFSDSAIPGTLLISPDIVIEERETGSTSSPTFDPLWDSQDDFTLDLVAAPQTSILDAYGEALGEGEEDVLLGRVDDGSWESLLDELAADGDRQRH